MTAMIKAHHYMTFRKIRLSKYLRKARNFHSFYVPSGTTVLAAAKVSEHHSVLYTFVSGK